MLLFLITVTLWLAAGEAQNQDGLRATYVFNDWKHQVVCPMHPFLQLFQHFPCWCSPRRLAGPEPHLKKWMQGQSSPSSPYFEEPYLVLGHRFLWGNRMNVIDSYYWKVRIDIYEYPTQHEGLHVYLKQIPGFPRGPQTHFKDPQSRFNQH